MSTNVNQKTVMIPTTTDVSDKTIVLESPWSPAGHQLEEIHLPKPAGMPIFGFSIKGDDKCARSIVSIALNKGNAKLSNKVVRSLAVSTSFVEKERDFQFLAFSDKCAGYGNRLILAPNGFPKEAFSVLDDESKGSDGEKSWWHIFPLTKIGEDLGNIAIGTCFIIVSAADVPGMISAIKTADGWSILGYGGPVYRRFIRTAYCEANAHGLISASTFEVKTIPAADFNPEIHF